MILASSGLPFLVFFFVAVVASASAAIVHAILVAFCLSSFVVVAVNFSCSLSEQRV